MVFRFASTHLVKIPEEPESQLLNTRTATPLLSYKNVHVGSGFSSQDLDLVSHLSSPLHSTLSTGQTARPRAIPSLKTISTPFLIERR